MESMNSNLNENIIIGKNQRFVLIVFLLGIFMGAIDSGIVSPARTIIQNSFGVTPNIGVWMITIYTLSYAVAMPIVSKLADKFGRKKFYVLGIALFGIGSLLCALSNYAGSFWFLLVARVIQAIGAGGIMPIANAVIGQSFPEEKRGTALGFVGAVYGVSTILGPTLGSSILDIAGNNSWGWLFIINVPISIIIILLSFKLPNSKGSSEELPMDFLGIFAVTGILLSLLYAITNLDFFNFSETIKNTNVYPFLIIFLIFIPIFIVAENKAKDPIINLEYFKKPQITFTLIISMIVGIGMMSMIFIPQFVENALKMKEGNGGYFITILSIASGFAAPISGKLIDKFSAKFSLMLGFLCNVSGFLYMALVASKIDDPSNITVIFGLILIGFGVGFTMGAPLNYMMLSYIKDDEAASGLATISVIRSIGISISPSIMVGFIANGGKVAGTKIQHILNNVLKQPSGMTSKMSSGGSKTSAMAENMKNAGLKMAKDLEDANVQTIFSKVKHGVENYILPEVLKPIPNFAQGSAKSGILENLDKVKLQIENTFRTSLNSGFSKMFIATAIISLVGLMLTLLLKNQKKTV